MHAELRGGKRTVGKERLDWFPEDVVDQDVPARSAAFHQSVRVACTAALANKRRREMHSRDET